MSGKSGVWVAVTVVALCLKLVLLASKGSRSHHDYDSYGSASAYDPYGSKYDPLKYAPSSYGALPADDTRSLEQELEQTVERHCQASSSVYLEPQGTQAAAFRSLRSSSAPKGVVLPQPWSVMGLQVLPLARRGDDVAVCLDADDALVRESSDRSEGPRAEALLQVGPGAWTVITAADDRVPAAAALVSKRFLARLSTKGALIAFAPTDMQVAFADSSSPAAVKLAARTLAPQVDVTGGSGLDFAHPLILRNGKWETWKPGFESPELTAVMRRSAEVNVAGAVGVLDDVAIFSNPLLRSLIAHPASVVQATPTVRTWDDASGATVDVAEDSLEPQWVGRADRVRVGTRTFTWKQFTAAAGDGLTAASVDGQPVPEVFLLSGGFHLPALASRAGP